MPYYIGIANSSHDPAVAVIDPNGELLFAESLERHFQKKRAWDIPPDHPEIVAQIIKEYCNPKSEMIVATSWKHLSFGGEKSSKGISDKAEIHLARDEKSFPKRDISGFLLAESDMHWLSWSHGRAFEGCGEHLKHLMWHRYGNHKISFRKYDHHLSHAAMGCYTSDYDNALCLVSDGEGEVGAVSIYRYESGCLKRIQRSWGPGSLGAFYAKITDICGFDWRKGEEGKVMGLAAYGQINNEYLSLMQELIGTSNGCRLSFAPENRIKKIVCELEEAIEGCSSKEKFSVQADIACTGQFVFEQHMEKLICNLHKKGGSDNLVLAGGCALNSSFNSKVIAHTPFHSVHVSCAPGDDGNALGAAALAYLEDQHQQLPSVSWKTPYLGSTINSASLARLLSFSPSGCVSHHPGTVHLEAARQLAKGKIIGWVQGRAEFGPRALGNRSIIADPRKAEMKGCINERVKFRETFRPFAPSILKECIQECFELPSEGVIDSRYMSFALNWRREYLDKVPAVVHEDGTGRVHTVTRAENIKFYDLIYAFYKLTNVPLILNTSFNIMGKPIIHSLEDAVAVLYTTGMDLLFIEDYMIRK